MLWMPVGDGQWAKPLTVGKEPPRCHRMKSYCHFIVSFHFMSFHSFHVVSFISCRFIHFMSFHFISGGLGVRET
jgi:hypothetical protein